MDRTWNPVARGIICAAIALSCVNALWAVEFAGGTGEPSDPYQIATAEQLVAIGSDPALLDRHFVLVDDIDLNPNLASGQVFSRSLIAPEIRNVHGVISGRFQGVFDGGGHVIRNLAIQTDSDLAAGLFGYVESPAQIKNLGVEGVDIRRSGSGTQAFVGGGLVAVNVGGAILGCYATGWVVETNQFKPYTWDTDSIPDCVGGLIGQNQGLVHGCYAIVDVQGDEIVGGLVGQNDGAVQFSFAAGVPHGSGWVGGLVGRNDAGTVRHSFWDAQTSGVAMDGAGTAKTSAELMSRETYESWTHTDAWMLDDANDYPRLLWEQAPGTSIGDTPPAYGGGRGTPEDPFRVGTVEQFIAIGYRPADFDKAFALTADLDFDGMDCNQVLPIGLEQLAFSGQFDGRSHSLSDLSILRPDDRCVGVFGIVGPSNVFPRGQTIHYDFNEGRSFGWGVAHQSRFDYTPATTVPIRNLHLRDVTVVGQEYVGGLIGLGQVVVEDCSVSGEVTGLSMVGGLLGRAMRGGLSGCSVDACVTGEFAVGGLAGATWLGEGLTVEDCLVRGSVTGQLHTGGLIGFAQGASDVISRSRAECDVQGGYFTGGCFGSTTGSTIAKSCARGEVTGGNWTGGFAGQLVYAAVADSYFVGGVSGEKNVGGFVGRCNQEHIARCYAAASVTASDVDSQCPLAGGFAGHAGTLNDGCLDACVVEAEGCFWDMGVSGPVPAVGNCPSGVVFLPGLTTSQMQTAATFLAAGWDFDNIWTVCEGLDYPRLQWETAGCDDAIATEGK